MESKYITCLIKYKFGGWDQETILREDLPKLEEKMQKDFGKVRDIYDVEDESEITEIPGGSEKYKSDLTPTEILIIK